MTQTNILLAVLSLIIIHWLLNKNWLLYGPTEYPLLFSLEVYLNKLPIPDFFVNLGKRFQYNDFTVKVLGDKRIRIASDNVEQISKCVMRDNIDNFIKNDKGRPVLGDHSIFMSSHEKWMNLRKNFLLFFTKQKFRTMYYQIFYTNTRKIQKLTEESFSSNKQVTDMQKIFYYFTFDSFCEIALSKQINSLDGDQKGIKFADAYDYIFFYFGKKWVYPLFIFNLLLKFTEGGRKFVSDRAFIDNWAIDTIKEAKEQKLNNPESYSNRCDFLTAILGQKNEHGEDYSDDQLKDIVKTFIIAGRDTTAQGMTFTCKCIADRTDLQKELVAEAKEILNDNQISYDDLMCPIKTKKMSAVITESLRHYPPVTFSGMVCAKDCSTENDIKLHKNEAVMWCPMLNKQNPNLWSNPHAFDYNRFIKEKDGLDQFEFPDNFKYTTFNSGKRFCIGKDMAFLEIKMVIYTLLLDYELKLEDGFEPKLNYGIGMNFENGLRVKLERRQ